MNIIAIGIASSYCNQTSPPPEANAINAGAPIILFVEHCVAITEIESLNGPKVLFAIK